MRSDLSGSCRPCRSMLSVSATLSVHAWLLIHSSALCVSVQHQGLRIWHFAPAFKINLYLKYLLSITSCQKLDKNLKAIKAKTYIEMVRNNPLGWSLQDDITSSEDSVNLWRAKAGISSLSPSSQHSRSLLTVAVRQQTQLWCAYLSDIQCKKHTTQCAIGTPSLEMGNDYRARNAFQ